MSSDLSVESKGTISLLYPDADKTEEPVFTYLQLRRERRKSEGRQWNRNLQRKFWWKPW